MNRPITQDRIIYGAKETAGLVNPAAYHAVDRSVTVDWTDPDLKQITRLRLVSDPGYPVWDVSYCHGELKNGQGCVVQLPFSQVPKGKHFMAFLIGEARRDNVYAKGLGLFDAISKLI